MSDEIVTFDEFDMSELSEDDLAIIQAFEAMDTWQSQGPSSLHQTNDQNQTPQVSQTFQEPPPALSPLEDKEMLLVFAAEVEEDISSIRQILNQVAQDEQGSLVLFITLERAGHKLHGTAGAVGFPLIATIAAQVEFISGEVAHSTINAHDGVVAISAATTVLEACLHLITSGSEKLEAPLLLASLKTVYQSLSFDLQQLGWEPAAGQTHTGAEKLLESPPPAHTSVSCFLVQAGDQHLLLPLKQIQHVSHKVPEQTDTCYSLQELLGFPENTVSENTVGTGLAPVRPPHETEPQESTSQYFLILSAEDGTMEGSTTSIVVDEVLEERECIIEPLASYLQRSGIIGTAIDGNGRVVLVLDLWELIRSCRKSNAEIGKV